MLIVCISEAIAEKLARYARDPLIRDLYDLWWYGRNRPLEEDHIRTLWLLKVYVDYVDEGRWKNKAFDVSSVFSKRNAKNFKFEQIGLYDGKGDPVLWELEFTARYQFLNSLAANDLTIANCNPRDRALVTNWIASLSESGQAFPRLSI